MWWGCLVLGGVFVSRSWVCRFRLCFSIEAGAAGVSVCHVSVFSLVSLVFCVQSNEWCAQPFCVAVNFLVLSLFFLVCLVSGCKCNHVSGPMQVFLCVYWFFVFWNHSESIESQIIINSVQTAMRPLYRR